MNERQIHEQLEDVRQGLQNIKECTQLGNQLVEDNDSDRLTALHMFAHRGHIEIVSLLLDNGCDIHAVTKDGITLLHLAAVGGKKECVQMLLDRGANIHAKSYSGATTLHFAALGGNTDCVQMIFDLGADVHAKDYFGRTAFDLAKDEDKTAVADLLKRLSIASPQSLVHSKAHTTTNTRPGALTAVEEPRKKIRRNNDCNRCLCKTCTMRENEIQQQNRKLKQNVSVLEDRMNTLQYKNITLKKTQVTMGDQLKSMTESNSAIKQENVTLKRKFSAMDDQLKSIAETFKRKLSEIESRMKSSEERESDGGSFPLVVTTMDGLNRKDVIGKDYMQPQMKRVFNNNTLQSFKNSLEPKGVLDYLWPRKILTEKQLQEIQGQQSDVGKAEYIWSLMTLKQRYLDAVREALEATGQHELASLLQPSTD